MPISHADARYESMEGPVGARFINTNVPAMFANRSLAKHQNGVATATERLSSGLRINRGAIVKTCGWRVQATC